MSRSKNLIGLCISSMAITLLANSTAQAVPESWDVLADPTNGFGGLTSSWGFTDPGAAHAAWNVFDSYPLDSTPDAGSFGFASASVTENTGGAFLTGGGNIYSFAVATDFTTTLSGTTSGTSSRLRTVALRFETLGNLLDPTSVTLSLDTGGPALAPDTTAILFDDPLGGIGGAEQELVFIWESVADGSYTFDFNAASDSMSLSQLASYMSPTVIPEPGPMLLLALGLGGLSAVGRQQARDPRHS